MSQMIDIDRVCSLCGVTSRQMILLESDARGSPDLDLRPPESLRSTISSWIQHCPSCGYCSTDIGQFIEGVDAIVRSREYRDQLSDLSLPLLARRFLCWSIILRDLHYTAKAGWAILHAAWVCDDAGDSASASYCRQQAFHSFSEARRSNIRFADGDHMEETILADLLRRSGRCDEAEAICMINTSASPELSYEQYLTMNRDQDVHRLYEARSYGVKPVTNG